MSTSSSPAAFSAASGGKQRGVDADSHVGHKESFCPWTRRLAHDVSNGDVINSHFMNGDVNDGNLNIGACFHR